MSADIISVKAILNAPTEIVWKALTTPTQMKNWYFAMEKFVAEPGYFFKMFGEKNGKYFPIHCTIVNVIPYKLLSYTWSYEEFPAETMVCFELTEKSKQTSLKLTHTGLTQIPASFTDLSIENHRKGWKNMIQIGLKNYVEDKK